MKAPEEFTKQEIWDALAYMSYSIGRAEGIFCTDDFDKTSENVTESNAYKLERMASDAIFGGTKMNKWWENENS